LFAFVIEEKERKEKEEKKKNFKKNTYFGYYLTYL
jgi:hypothetical protein